MAKVYDQDKFKETYYYRATWLQLIRPLTLTGTITPILVSTGYAYHEGYFQINLLIAFYLQLSLFK